MGNIIEDIYRIIKQESEENKSTNDIESDEKEINSSYFTNFNTE